MSIALPLDQMTLADKLRTMETLWDDLCRHSEALPVPQWHKEILEERERQVQRGEARFSDWEAARKRIDERTS